MRTLIKLKYPVTVDNVEYKELGIRRSKIKDRLAVSSMKASDEYKEVRLFANLCEVEPKVIEELDEEDYIAVQKVYLSFFGSTGTSNAK